GDRDRENSRHGGGQRQFGGAHRAADESDQRGGHQQRKERSHRGPAQDQRRQTVADRGPVDYRAHLLGITHRLARMGCKTDVHTGWRYSGYVPINISRISQGALWDLATTKSQSSL